MGFGLVIGFIAHLQLGITSNCSAIADSLTLQFTTACTVLSVCCVFTGCHLVTAPNVIDSSASVFYGTGHHWLMPISQLYSLLSRAIPHALMAHRLHSLTANSRLTACRPTHSPRTHSLTNFAVHYDMDYFSQSSLALPGSGSQCWMFLCFRVHVLSVWRPSHANL
jgi:hypothetical protein